MVMHPTTGSHEQERKLFRGRLKLIKPTVMHPTTGSHEQFGILSEPTSIYTAGAQIRGFPNLPPPERSSQSEKSPGYAGGRWGGVLDLEAQFAFFRSQHRHPVNAAAHALLTGPILFTNLLILQFLPLPSPLDPALALSLAYAAAYLLVDRRAGALAALLFLAAWAASRNLAARLGFALSWKVVLATQLFCWTWQFLGHGLFEKRGPTVSELPEVFLMEPFLILLQILNKLFGYEPYPGFSKNVDKKVEADLRESREFKQRKIN